MTECYMTIIVSGFSLLITVLIGWQIYQVIDFNQKKKELKESFDAEKSKLFKECKDREDAFLKEYGDKINMLEYIIRVNDDSYSCFSQPNPLFAATQTITSYLPTLDEIHSKKQKKYKKRVKDANTSEPLE